MSLEVYMVYDERDFEIVAPIIEVIRIAKHRVWDSYREIPPGVDIDRARAILLYRSDVVLFCVTGNAITSDTWNRQLTDAVGRLKKWIIPVLCAPNKAFVPESLTRYQIADFSMGETAYNVAELLATLYDPPRSVRHRQNLQKHAKSNKQKRNQLRQYFYAKALRLYEGGLYQECLERLDDLLRLDPEHPEGNDLWMLAQSRLDLQLPAYSIVKQEKLSDPI